MNNGNRGPNIVVIGGSVRPGNFTWKALDLVVSEFQQHPEINLQVFNPAEMDLPLPGLGKSNSDTQELQQAVSNATGVVLATPEYHGSFSSVMKLVIENLGFPSILKGKPVALLGVAAGRIGAIKSLEQLRGVCSHVGALVLPGTVSIAGVQSLFDEQGHCSDGETERLIRSVATSLLDYIHHSICPDIALEEIIRSGQRDETAATIHA
ncbi:MAG: NAD(P)H-dependent oxidoreductase [Armatimonadota bacterium]|nr:NAD(P)H-dependent oxidoreductase [Armatimonadota bacterium]